VQLTFSFLNLNKYQAEFIPLIYQTLHRSHPFIADPLKGSSCVVYIVMIWVNQSEDR